MALPRLLRMHLRCAVGLHHCQVRPQLQRQQHLDDIVTVLITLLMTSYDMPATASQPVGSLPFDFSPAGTFAINSASSSVLYNIADASSLVVRAPSTHACRCCVQTHAFGWHRGAGFPIILHVYCLLRTEGL